MLEILPSLFSRKERSALTCTPSWNARLDGLSADFTTFGGAPNPGRDSYCRELTLEGLHLLPDASAETEILHQFTVLVSIVQS